MSVGEITSRASHYPGGMVEITGGEPLLQENVYHLITQLEQHHLVLLETNGSYLIDKVSPNTVVILDVKCPESGASSSFHHGNIEQLLARKQLGAKDEVKFVLNCEEDFLWAKIFIYDNKLDQMANILFSPIQENLSPNKLASLILQHQLPVRLQLQLHTVIWPMTQRGV